MSDSDLPSVKRAASSWVTAIATRPMLALIIVLLLVLLASGVSGYFVSQSATKARIQALKDQAKEYEETMALREQEYQKKLGPIIAQRNALKKRIEAGKIPAKPPKDEKELIERFGKLGY